MSRASTCTCVPYQLEQVRCDCGAQNSAQAATKHLLTESPSGLFTAYYMSTAENVTMYARTAKMWKFVLDDEAGLPQLKEIAEAFPDATHADFIWLIDTLESVETWLEVCPHDLRRYGETGVSY